MKTYLTILFYFFYLFSFSQCFNSGGIGDFEGDHLLNKFVTGTQSNGTIELTSEDKYTGNKCLKANVSVAGVWQVRIFNTGACYFDMTSGESYTVSFYAKGEIGDAINVSIMSNTTVDKNEDIVISSSSWRLYTTTFEASVNSSAGRIKLIFKDQGTYYVDDIQLNGLDCNSDFGGSASIDNCGICSGGNTSITPINDCSFQSIYPTNSHLIFEGANDIDLSESKATLYRFKKEYALGEVQGYYEQKRAGATSGVKLRFKTNSPKIKAYFQENTSISDDLFWHTFDVFKNGEYQFDSQGWEIEMENPSQEIVEWSITLPTFSNAEFLNLEILNGFSLSPISKNKPVYIAIGNSITHGIGINTYSTRLTYPYIIADSLGYELYNWGIGGSKIYDGILSNFSTGLEPDLISILWGYNDVHYSGSDAYLANNSFPQYETILTSLLNNYPNACVLAILPTYTTNQTNTHIRTIDSLKNGQLQIIQQLQKSYSNLTYLNGNDYTEALSLNDDVHLNQSGNQSLAYGIINDFNCEILTSKESRKFKKIKIWPNPTNGFIQWDQKKSFSVIDTHGKTLFSGTDYKVDLGAQPPGVYFIKLGSENKIILKI